MACVSGDELGVLIARATNRGYSRRCRGMEIMDTQRRYIITPFLMERAPEPAWICSILELPDGDENIWHNGLKRGRFKLDVSLRDFKQLNKLSGRELDSLAHILVWAAIQSEQP